MEYVQGKPYFYCNNKNKISQFPYLNKDINCDILIVGAGVNGAILNYYLSFKYNVVLVDKGRIGASCTSCATALLEYQLDDFANDIAGLSEEEVVDVYSMGLYSINKIKKFVEKHGNYCNFATRPTLLYSTKKDKNIIKEYEFRKKHNFKCELITENNSLPFPVDTGIYCEDGGCEFDPYLFTKQMIDASSNQQNTYENTCVVDLTRINDKWVCTTSYGQTITYKYVIISTGFQWDWLGEDLCERFLTYTIVTNPQPKIAWKDNALVQDSSEPYHYMRKLPDDRIIFGGDDESWNINKDNKNCDKKYNKLLDELKEMFVDFKDEIKVDYSFCGAFASTNNNLGVVGKTEKENLLYFFSCGANGIINAMYAVEIIDDIIQGKENKLAHLFSPLRKNL